MLWCEEKGFVLSVEMSWFFVFTVLDLMSFLKEELAPPDIEQNIGAGRHTYRPKDFVLLEV